MMTDDRDFEAKLRFLTKELLAGRFSVSDIETLAKIRQIKWNSDGTLDIGSITPTVSNIVADFDKIFKMGSSILPLAEIQKQYFETLRLFLSDIIRIGKKYSLNAQELATLAVSNQDTVKKWQDDRDTILHASQEFWSALGPDVEFHLSQMRTVKTVFGGDMFPSYLTNIASSVGLYVDTIVLPDPILRLTGMGSMPVDKQLFYLVKHGINALGYEEFALAKTENPIVVFKPDEFMLEKENLEFIRSKSSADALQHLSRVFGTRFDCYGDYAQFMSGIETIDDICQKIVCPERMLFDVDYLGLNMKHQIRKYLESTQKDGLDIPGHKIKNLPYLNALGRMMQTNEAIYRSTLIGGHPLIDAPTSWQYFKWRCEEDSSVLEKDALVAKALQIGGSEELTALADLPVKALIELRQRNLLGELRETISTSIREISSASQNDFEEVQQKVQSNLRQAFDSHKKAINDLSSSKRKLILKNYLPWCVRTSIALAAISTHNELLVYATAVLATLGLPGLVSTHQLAREFINRRTSLKNSPIGILFKYKKR